MYKNPIFTEDGGVLVEQPDGINLHIFEGEIFEKAVAGDYGTVAAYVAPPPPTTEELAAQARAERDQLLAATDWTQAADVLQSTKDKWAPYRQALRDVPQQELFPEQIAWPVKPE